MKHDLICTWLDLTADNWPPTHYQLLGLRPREENASLIELRVHQRLERVRCYQLTHPEQATEALNRLAQAYVCLTDSDAKRCYDALLVEDGAVVVLDAEPTSGNPCVSTDTPVPGRFPLPGRPSPRNTGTPPPLPAGPCVLGEELVIPGISTEITPEAVPEVPPEEVLDDAAIEATLPPLRPAEDLPDRPPVCPLEEAARSRQACSGLCSRRGLLQRVKLLRQLMHTWNQVGRLLPSSAVAGRKVNPRARGQALIRYLNKMQDLLAQFPSIFGEAGQPGFLVLGLLEREQAVYKLFTQDADRQSKLAEDWQAGHNLLRAHARVVQEMIAQYRGQSLLGRAVLALRNSWQHKPLVIYSLIGLAGVNCALWGWYAYRWLSGQILMP